ncbi:hypothetical protein [Planomicrobium sp. CPCC 101079]|uniref:hypothetical protein n=1 Tax=Planomicrobium sp. CPCC 101079 TaxID=2599618 RepID=UPI0011B4E78C|nr:hypothetical protein [Planomicrobium sp. CPCC 101079]TWT01806.1 hypothetical protein FQV28_14310 [Planomicrobium sp. CPCC 101079]
MNPKEIIELLSVLRRSLGTDTSQAYVDKEQTKSLKVWFLKATDTFYISDTATDFLWKFTSIEQAAIFINDYLPPDTDSYVSFIINPRK